MNLSKFPASPEKRESQLKVSKFALTTSWERMQNLVCDFAYVINHLCRLTWASYYELIFNIKNRNIRCQTNWYKVGNVINLYTYPLFAASEEEISECSLTRFGMIGIDNDSEVRNHMFIVYNSETKYVIHDCDNYIMRGIRIISVGKNKMVLQCLCTHYVIILDINKISTEKSATIRCLTSFCNQFLTYINCIDCGVEAANWISKCLKVSNLRLGYTIPQTAQTPFWKHIQQIYREKQDKRNFTVSSSCLPICTLIPSPLRGWIGNKLTEPVNTRDFQPNIVISTNSLYDLIEWEWIMVGNAIVRNFRPWRSRQTKLDGQNMPVNMMLRLLPLQCELYFPGQVRVGDGVYVKMSTKKN